MGVKQPGHPTSYIQEVSEPFLDMGSQLPQQ